LQQPHPSRGNNIRFVGLSHKSIGTRRWDTPAADTVLAEHYNLAFELELNPELYLESHQQRTHTQSKELA
jgi:hypothetical protein